LKLEASHSARPLAAALSLRGVSAYAVVPIHFLLIQAAHEGRFDGLPPAGFALAAASIALAALVLAKGFAALLGRAHAAGPTTLRAAAGALLLACALGLWALPAVHRLAFESQALVTLGQLALGAWLRPPAIAVAIGAAGIGLSAVVNVVLQQWEITRFAITEPELVGPTAALFAVLVGLAVAGFGALAAPRRLLGWPMAAVALGFIGVAIIVGSNVPDLDDGIAAESWPLAIWVGLSGVYALVVGGLVLRRAMSRSPDPVEG